VWQWGRGKVQRRGRSDNRQGQTFKVPFFWPDFQKFQKKESLFFGKISPFKNHSSTKLDVVEIGRTLHPERLQEEVIHKRTQNLCLGSIHLFFKKMDRVKGRQEKKKKQAMLLYCLQEGPIADFILLPSPLHTEMCEDSTL
jgi:hypothetical protein